MKKTLNLMASMLAIAAFAMGIVSCNEKDNGDSPDITVGSVKFDTDALYLELDATQTLTATLEPEDAPNESVVWESYNTEIATVSSTGDLTAVVTAKSTGTTMICAVASNGKRAICEVTVSETVPLVAITLKPGELSLHIETKNTVEIIATQGPANATNYRPVWTTSDTAVAIVEKGKITAVGAGTATVTVASGDISKSIEILVTDPLSRITISSDSPEDPLRIREIGETLQLVDVPFPEITKDYNPVWESSDESILTVSETGLVTAVKIGTASVIVSSGGISDTVDIKVTSAYLVDIDIVQGRYIPLSVNATLQIDAAPVPETAENYVLTWSTSDPFVASVSSTGLVTGISPGIAVITVSSNSTSDGHTIKKLAFVFVDTDISDIPKLPTAGWTAESRNGNHGWDVNGGEPRHVLDGDRNTGWHSRLGAPLPHCLVIDMKETKTVDHLVHWQRLEVVNGGWWQVYLQDIYVYISEDPVTPDVYQPSWGDPIGYFPYVKDSTDEAFTIDLTPSQGQYLILYFPTSTHADSYLSLGDLDVYGVD
jgi:uncharacterized protein YjdB